MADGHGQRADRLLAGRYLLVEEIGRGGMGAVWRARDEDLGREVAVKEVHVPGHLDAEQLAVLRTRMMQEARAAARISHPGVITVHDVIQEDGAPYIVMELIKGRSLSELLKQDGPLEPRRAAALGSVLAEVLAASHRAGVLHRDVKPSNVLIADEDGRVLLSDFGIASLEGETELTRTGDIVGSPEHLPPERARGGRPEAAGDIWALGITLYQAVEGVSPFRRDSLLATLHAVASEDPPRPERAGALLTVLQVMLCKDPQDRPDAATVQRMLKFVSMSEDTGASWAKASVAGAVAPMTTVDEATPVTRASATPATAVVPQLQPQPPTATAPAYGYPQQPGGTPPQAQPAVGQPELGRPTFAQETPPATQLGYALPPQSPPPPGTGRSAAAKRRGVWIAVAAVLTAVIAGGGTFLLVNRDDPKDSDNAARPKTSASAKKQPGSGSSGKAKDSSKDSGKSKDSSRSPSASPSDGPPEGYQQVTDPGGFSMVVPDGWERQVNSGQIDYVKGDGTTYLRVGVLDPPENPTVLAHFQDMERKAMSTRPDYVLLQMTEKTHDGNRGAIWEFSYSDTQANPIHAIDQGFISADGKEFALYATSLDGDWTKTREIFDNAMESFKQN